MLEKSSRLGRHDTKQGRRRACSWCTLILFAIAILLIFAAGRPLISLLRFLKKTRFYEFPQPEFFVNETNMDRVGNRSDVVQPLVGLNDTFDIAVTVWQLATEEEKYEQFWRLQDKKYRAKSVSQAEPDYFTGGNATPEAEDEAARLHSSFVRWHEDISLVEKTIFPDIVFRGLRLSDADIHTNVTFQIPTEIFHNHPGTNYDLRASFVLLPHSPSPLDYFKGYTSWFPDVVRRPRFKSFPFPLNSPTEQYRRPSDRALDSFAITIPLIERHEVPSMCPRPASPDGGNLAQDDEGREYYGHHDRWQADDEILKKHPHIITRTQIRVVRESRLFRRDVYLKMHEVLRKTSCGQRREDTTPHLRFCRRSYHRNGNWETMLQLKVPDEDADGGSRSESAYAPYMDVFQNAAGPKDIVPVPIDRERCGMHMLNWGNRTKFVEQEYMNITWRLSYSGVTPRMFLLGETLLVPPQRSDYNESDFTRALRHDAAEIQGSLAGHRYNKHSHPRRRLTRLTLSILTFFFLVFLNCIYWMSRSSTVSISVPGTLFIIAGDMVALAVILRNGLQAGKLGGDLSIAEKGVWLAITLGLRRFPLPLLMLKAVAKVEVLMEGALPSLQRVRATHRERASARLDAQTDWRWKGGIFSSLLLTYYALNLQRRFIIHPIIPEHHPGELVHSLSVNIFCIVDSLKMAGGIMQLILNHRSKVFAGQYKMAVFLDGVLQALSHVSSVQWIVGTSEVMSGVMYADVAWGVVWGVNCWQAWVYSSWIPEDDEGEEDVK
ncbi:hypothetical protein B0H10DRAFT_2233966 [Mycena sp. CBHHK59/15]|nr:hypothetical protein B0H10DRAFT_2233966 [Mycena sp. CBHHK59/15]